MIELHPTYLPDCDNPKFVVLPYSEFVQALQVLRQLDGCLPPPDPRYGGYWDNLSAEELARRQGVKPVASPEELYGHGDPADWEGFDEAVEGWRNEYPK